MPSPSLQNKPRTKTQQEAETSQSTITVGDKVTVKDAPSYWSWASPLTVEAINGEWAKLEMVSELVETNRLSLTT